MAQSLREDLTRAAGGSAITAGTVGVLTPAPKVAGQFGVTRRTLSRWIIDDALAFPRPVEINRRLYFKQREIDVWKASRRAVSMEAA